MRKQYQTPFTAIAISIVIALISFNSASAFPGWAKKAAKQAQKVEIDPRAEYILLLSKTEIKYFAEGRSLTKIRRAYKILSATGAEEFAFFAQTSPAIKLSKFKTWTLSPSGKKAEATKESIRYIPVSRESTIYMDDRYAYKPYANLQIGSIVAQEYEIDDSDLGTYFTDIIFQRQQPTLKTELRAIPPKGWELFASGLSSEELVFKRDGQWYTWKSGYLPFQPDEPLSPGWNYLTRRIGIACYNPYPESADGNSTGSSNHDKQSGLDKQSDIDKQSNLDKQLESKGQFLGWNSVSRWVREIYDPIAKPDSAARRIVDSLAQSATSKTELVTKIAEYVSKQIRYVSVSLGNGRYVPHSIKETLINGYGDCKDKTTLTRAMLAAAGVPSVATLTSIKTFVNPNLPSPYQFNHCIVGIPLDDSLDFEAHATIGEQDWLFIDPTDYITPIGSIPAPLMGASVLLASQEDSTFMRLPYSKSDSWRKKTIVSGTINVDGAMTADIQLIQYGAFVWYLDATLKNQSANTIEKELTEGAKLIAPTLKLSQFDFQCFEDSCVVSYHVEDAKYALKVGEELICKINPMEIAGKRQLAAKIRKHPIWFGPPSTTETEVSWQLPKNSTVSLKIDTTSLKSKTGETLIYFSSIDSSKITYRSLVKLSGKLLYADEYELAQEFDAAVTKTSGRVFGVMLSPSERIDLEEK